MAHRIKEVARIAKQLPNRTQLLSAGLLRKAGFEPGVARKCSTKKPRSTILEARLGCRLTLRYHFPYLGGAAGGKYSRKLCVEYRRHSTHGR
jgi:hypothetical protein